MEQNLSFKELYKKVLDFNKARGWIVEPSDLAKSVVIEAAELLEHFQWDTGDVLKGKNYKSLLKSKDKKEISFEIADVMWYLFNLCNVLDINPLKALEEKYAHNAKKYPEEMFNKPNSEEEYYKRKAEYRRKKSTKQKVKNKY